MGRAKDRAERFKTEHPFCCFCGGTAPVHSIDHVPNRASFKNREGPEGYEFPACAHCQNETRLDEIVFSCLVHFNHDENAEDGAGLRRLLEGLRNNLPHIAYFPQLSANQKRRAIRQMMFEKPAGTALRDLPMVQVSPEFNERAVRYIRKLGFALFYKHIGYPAPASWASLAWWSQGRQGNLATWMEEWESQTPFSFQAKRTNFNFGDRFKYRIGYSLEDQSFSAVGQFGGGLIFYVRVVNPTSAKFSEL